MSKNFYSKKGGSLKSFLQGHNTITLNIKHFNKQRGQRKKNQQKLDSLVQEKAITRMIEKMKMDLENVPFFTLKNLAEVFQIYEEYMYWYTFGAEPLPVTNEQVKENTKSINKVYFLSEKNKKHIIKKMKKLHKSMSNHNPNDPNLEIHWDDIAYENLLQIQILMMEDFVKDGDVKELMKINAIYKHDKNNKYKRTKILNEKNIENYQKKSFIDKTKIIKQILRFYNNSRIHSPVMQKWKHPIIDYKNKMPVFHPDFFKLKNPFTDSYMEIDIYDIANRD